MLFPYTYVPHRMEKMQSFIDFIFYAVWCQAPSKGAYRLELFAWNPELLEVMTTFHYDDSIGADFFSGHVERIYALFAPLSACQVEQLRLWYRANNDVERVCANDHAMSLSDTLTSLRSSMTCAINWRRSSKVFIRTWMLPR